MGLLRTIVVVAALAAIARAEPTGEQRAATLFAEGRAFAKAGNYATACERFAASLALKDAPGTRLNLADCDERLGRLAEAFRLFSQISTATTDSNPQRTKLATERAAALAKRIATVIVRVDEPDLAGLAIKIGGRDISPDAEIRERVDPGKQDIVATAPAWHGFATTITAVAGRTTTIEITIAEEANRDHTTSTEPDADTASPPDDEAPVPDRTSTIRRRSWVQTSITLGLLGASSAVVGGVIAVLAKREYDGAIDRQECHLTTDGLRCTVDGNAHIDRAGTLADAATGLAIGAAATGLAAAIIYVAAPRDRAIQVAPIGDAVSSVGLALRFAF